MKRNSKTFLKLGLSVVITPLMSLINPQLAGASTLYGTDYAGPAQATTLVTIDPSTGDTTVVGEIGFNQCGAMAFNSAGQLFAACNRADDNIPVLITINPLTGVGTEIGPNGIPGDVSDISFRPGDNQLFALSVTTPYSLYTIDVTTGQATLVGETGLPEGILGGGNGMAFSDSNTLFLSNTQFLYTLNPTTATPTVIAPSSFSFSSPVNNPRINSLDFDPQTGALYATVRVGGGSNALTYLGILNTTTGLTTIVGPTLNRLDGLAWSPNIEPVPVPESKSFGLLSAGILLLFGYLGTKRS